MINRASSTFKFRRHRDLTPRMSEEIYHVVLRGINVYYETLREMVPVFTGRLRMSFYPLGEALASAGVRRNTGTGDIAGKIKANTVSQVSGASATQYDISLENKSYRKWTKVRLPKKAQKTQYTFVFSSKSPYYGANDTQSHPNIRSAPWFSQQAALSNMQEYIASRLPKIAKGILAKDFKNVTDVTVSTDPLSGWLPNE